MICLRPLVVTTRSCAFTLLETLVMMVTLIAFAFLLAGVTKPIWHPASEEEGQAKTMHVPVAPAK